MFERLLPRFLGSDFLNSAQPFVVRLLSRRLDREFVRLVDELGKRLLGRESSVPR